MEQCFYALLSNLSPFFFTNSLSLYRSHTLSTLIFDAALKMNNASHFFCFTLLHAHDTDMCLKKQQQQQQHTHKYTYTLTLTDFRANSQTTSKTHLSKCCVKGNPFIFAQLQVFFFKEKKTVICRFPFFNSLNSTIILVTIIFLLIVS